MQRITPWTALGLVPKQRFVKVLKTSSAGAEFQYAEKSLQDQPGGPVALDKGQFLTLTVPLLHLPGTFLAFCTAPGYPPLEEATSRNPYPAWQKWDATSLSRCPLFQTQGAWDSYKSAVNLECARTIHNHTITQMNERFSITVLPYQKS